MNTDIKNVQTNLAPFIVNNFYCNYLSGNYMENNLLYVIAMMLKDEIDKLDNINQVDNFLEKTKCGFLLEELRKMPDIQIYFKKVILKTVEKIERTYSFREIKFNTSKILEEVIKLKEEEKIKLFKKYENNILIANNNINNNINNNNINNNINNNNEINYEYKPVIPNNNNINNNFSIPQLDDNIYNNPMLNRFRTKTSTVTINQNQNYSINEINENIPSLNSRVTPRNFVQKLNYLDDNQINSTNNNNNININNNNNNNEKNINSYDKYLRRNYSSQNFSDNINNNNNNNNNQKINNIDMIEYKKQLQQREAELIGKYNNNYSKYKKELDEQRFKLNENFSHQNNISYLNTKDENVPYYIKNHAKKDQIPTNPFNLRENDLGPSFLSDNPILYPSNTYKFDIRRLTPNSYYNKKY